MSYTPPPVGVCMNRVLVGVVDVGFSKNYALEKLNECLAACVEGEIGVEIEWFGNPNPRYRSHLLPPVNNAWADEIVYVGKQAIQDRALEGGYDFMLMQGIDCWWESREGFQRFLRGAITVPICGALTVGRMSPEYPVVRRWVLENGRISANQIDVERWEIEKAIREHRLIPCGFPGSEAMTVRRDVLEQIMIRDPRYEMWFNRPEGVPRLCVEEFFCWQAAKNGINIYCDPTTLTWHANDTDEVHSYDHTYVPIQELSW